MTGTAVGQIQRVSVLDVARDYGIPTNYIKDTNLFISHINMQTTDYVSRASQCADISTRAQTMLVALRNDYQHRDGMIWLDGRRGIYDFEVYEPKLQELSMVALRYSQHFLHMEQARQKISANEALSVEEADRQRIQQTMNDEARILKDSADYLHDSVSSVCIYNLTDDKELAKERKDIYYAYLPIYNRISMLPVQSTENTLKELKELLWMQNNLLSEVVCDSGYAVQIEHFSAYLKSYSASDATDIYRAYVRHFTHTSAPIYFNNIAGYRRYVGQLRDITTVQKQYMRVVDQRRQIRLNNDTIDRLYASRYPKIRDSYRRTAALVQTMPSFNRIEESRVFVATLDEFLAMQELYKKNYYRLEQIRLRSEKIVNECPKNCNDLRAAYMALPGVDNVIPTFQNAEQYEKYNQSITAFEQLQDDFQVIISLRDSINRNNDLLTNSPHSDRVFINGYKAIRKEASFSSVIENELDRKESIERLNQFLEKQRLCLKILQRKETIEKNDRKIKAQEKRLPNVCMVYNILRKDFEYDKEITDVEGMQKYHVHLIEIADIQHRFLTIIDSEQAQDINTKMRGLRDMEQIKRLFHL
ncbi:MAG: hypothetical protein IJ620_05370 [Bacteroidales bacterium]|nr:hypothetical protein [Bacteroidales bacterium]